MKELYKDKFLRIMPQTLFARLPELEQAFIREKAFQFQLTLQELKLVTEIALDFNTWNEPSIVDVWPGSLSIQTHGREAKKHALHSIRDSWNKLKSEPNSYRSLSNTAPPSTQKPKLINRTKEQLGLGPCPVASVKTRCCQLLTLDAVENCGFDCNYCSIQSFYHGNEIHFDTQFSDKLARLSLDPNETYHIGTGQSSDSLMWANKNGILDALMAFARNHPNVILELKTKSRNVNYLLKHSLPKNIICTWSLNTPTLITHEERLTASLEERLNAARKLADRGILVGFHFHPIIHYEHWRQDYGAVFQELQSMFHPSEVVMISLGTLTFIKPVINRIRNRQFTSKILQMPLVDCDGKLSYPDELKIEMFSYAYQKLKNWHQKVFFYLCMENHRLWQPVFGFGYPSNEAFETAMKQHYMDCIAHSKSNDSNVA
jgi:spore photoproduct lyase